MNFHFRLPSHIKPVKYRLKIKPAHPNYETFKGICKMEFHTEVPTNTIILHADNLVLKKVMLTKSQQIFEPISVTYSEQYQQYMFQFKQVIPSIATLIIRYDGKIVDELSGFIRVKSPRHVLYTQFQPIAARKMFPCLDEPSFKAKFQIDVYLDKQSKFNVISNTIGSIIDDPTYNIYRFSETPIMSTYLVALYFSEDQIAKKFLEINGREILLGVSNDKLSHDKLYDVDLDYTFKIVSECIIKCQEYLQIQYPFGKIDLVEVSDFSAGAMENIGLIIGRIGNLIFRKEDTNDQRNYAALINTASIICHEIIHQWFGNLVTVKWWSDIWLNESFTTWLSYKIIKQIYPEYIELINEIIFMSVNRIAFCNDLYKSARPIVSEITSNTDINNVFDNITYYKGCIVLNMIEQYMGEENMRSALHTYMENNTYGGTMTQDLMYYLNRNTSDVSKLFHNWIYHTGYPMISCKKVEKGWSLMQMPFHNESVLWNIPLKNGVMKTKYLDIIESSKSDKFIDSMLNPDLFVVALFDDKTIEQITDSNYINTKSNITIAKILNDLFLFVLSNKVSFSKYINYVRKIYRRITFNRKNYIVLLELLNIHYSYFKLVIQDDTYVGRYEQALEQTLVDHKETHIAFSILVKMHNPSVTAQCLEVWGKVKQSGWHNLDKSSISPYLVFYTAILTFQNEVFDLLLVNLFDDPKYTDMIIDAISFTDNLDRYQKVLNLFFDDRIYIQDKPPVLRSASKNKLFNKHIWYFIRDNWDRIYQIIRASQFGLSSLFESMERLVDTNDNQLVDDLLMFSEKYESLMLQKYINILVDKITLNTKFNNSINI